MRRFSTHFLFLFSRVTWPSDLVLEHFQANVAVEGGDVDVRCPDVPGRPRVLHLRKTIAHTQPAEAYPWCFGQQLLSHENGSARCVSLVSSLLTTFRALDKQGGR